MAMLTDEGEMTVPVPTPQADRDGGPLTLPDVGSVGSTEAITQFMVQVGALKGKHGVPTLIRNLDNLLRHKGLFDRSLAAVQANVQRLNGQRTLAQRAGDAKRTAAYSAQRFYEGLSEKVLLAQAKLAGLNPNLYETQEELITALVAWYHEQAAQKGGGVDGSTVAQ